MVLDDMDMKVLRENFDDETISQMDNENIEKIMDYLAANKVDYAKDLLISSLDLFLWPADTFINHFEKLKKKLGSDFVDKLGEDCSLIKIMYED